MTSADGWRPRRPLVWPWILGSILGLLIAGFAWVVTGFVAWFNSGGTLGGLGASAGAYVDWGRLQELQAYLMPIPVLVAGVIPFVWAWLNRKSHDGEITRVGALRVVAVVVAILALSLAPFVRLQIDRAGAIEPDRTVVEALRSVSDGPLERRVERPFEDLPWLVVYRTPTIVDLADVTAAAPAGGEWLCEEEYDRARIFRSDHGVAILAREEDRIELRSVQPRWGDRYRPEHCS